MAAAAEEARIATDPAKIGFTKNLDYVFVCSLVMTVFGIFAICAGCVKFDDPAGGCAFCGTLVCTGALALLAWPVVSITGALARNLTGAQDAVLKLNTAFGDGCVDALTMVDMRAFDASTSSVLGGSNFCYLFARIALLFQLTALISSGVYYFVCLKFPFESDREYCERERQRNEQLLRDEEAKREVEEANAVNS